MNAQPGRRIACRLFLSAEPPPALEPALPSPLLLVRTVRWWGGGTGHAPACACLPAPAHMPGCFGNQTLAALQACCKLTTEPPGGLRANLVRAYKNFNDDTFESCSRQSELK